MQKSGATISKKPSIAIVVATYNGETHLTDQLESLAQQTYLPDQVLICDDGSSDRTIEIARTFASRVPFAVDISVNEARLGYADNFLKGAGRAETDLIAFCDQDDIWLPEKIERSIGAFRDPDVLLFSHTSIVVNTDLQPTGDLSPNWRKDKVYNPLELNLYSGASGFSMVFSSKLVKHLDWRNRPIGFNWYPNAPISHDRWVMLFASILGKIEVTKQPLALYRQHEKNTTYLPNRHPTKKAFGRLLSRKDILSAAEIQWMRDRVRDDVQSLSDLISFLERMEESQTGNWKNQIGIASNMYKQFLPRFKKRASLYDPQIPRVKRSFILLYLFATGAYREELPGAFRFRFLPRDAASICFG